MKFSPEMDKDSALAEMMHKSEHNSDEFVIVKQHTQQEDGVDQRLFRRFNMRLLGRFMREDQSEHQCRVTNISAGGIAIASDAHPEIGEHIIVYLDHIGRAEGKVARTSPTSFAICFEVSDAQRERMALKISWLVKQMDGEMPEMRRHHRFDANNKETTLMLPEDIEITCTVENFSLSGASVITTARPGIGSEVVLGRMKGTVVRHHKAGIGIEFKSTTTAAYLLAEFGIPKN